MKAWKFFCVHCRHEMSSVKIRKVFSKNPQSYPTQEAILNTNLKELT